MAGEDTDGKFMTIGRFDPDDPKFREWLRRSPEREKAAALDRQAAARADALRRAEHWSAPPGFVRAVDDAAFPGLADGGDALFAGFGTALNHAFTGFDAYKPGEATDEVYRVNRERLKNYKTENPVGNFIAETVGGMAQDKLTGGLGKGLKGVKGAGAVVGPAVAAVSGAVDGVVNAEPGSRARDAFLGAARGVALDLGTGTAVSFLDAKPVVKSAMKSGMAAAANDASSSLAQVLMRPPAPPPTTPLAQNLYYYNSGLDRNPLLDLKLPSEEQRRANWGSSYPAGKPTPRPRMEPKSAPSRRY